MTVTQNMIDWWRPGRGCHHNNDSAQNKYHLQAESVRRQHSSAVIHGTFSRSPVAVYLYIYMRHPSTPEIRFILSKWLTGTTPPPQQQMTVIHVVLIWAALCKTTAIRQMLPCHTRLMVKSEGHIYVTQAWHSQEHAHPSLNLRATLLTCLIP